MDYGTIFVNITCVETLKIQFTSGATQQKEHVEKVEVDGFLLSLWQKCRLFSFRILSDSNLLHVHSAIHAFSCFYRASNTSYLFLQVFNLPPLDFCLVFKVANSLQIFGEGGKKIPL